MKHGAVLARQVGFGAACRYTVSRIDSFGISPDLAALTGIDVDAAPFWAVYPEEYAENGGIVAAIMDQAPILEFGDIDESEKFADAMASALNFFAQDEKQ